MAWPISEKFAQTIAHDHRVVQQVDLLVDGAVEVDLTAEGVVVDGSVSVQRGDRQRSATVTLVDESGLLLPESGQDLLAPVGNELRLWRGAAFGDVATDRELVPVGTLRFTVTRAQWPTIQLECFDRSWAITKAKLESTLVIDSGTNYVEAISNVLTQAWGADLPTNFPDTDETTPTMVFEEDSDVWEVASELAGNLGMYLYFDPLGICTMIPEPDPGIAFPQWSFDDTDVENLTLPGLELTWDSTNAVNRVIVVGENSDNTAVYRGVATDDDPHSPTQYGGKFGRHTLFIRDEKISSQALADQRSQTELRQRLGIVQTVTIPSMVNPAFDVPDVALVRSDQRGADTALLFERFTVPLRAAGGGMRIETRSRLVTG